MKRNIKQKDGTFKSKANYQISIDGYRAIAEKTGKYVGSEDYVFDEGITQYAHIRGKRGLPITASATVNKIIGKQKVGITATAQWSAYCPSDERMSFMWKKMPYLMLGKVAEALALRKAFPNVLGDIYVQEEMENIEPIKEDLPKLEKPEVIKPKEEIVKGTEEVDVYKDFEKRIKKAKTKEEKLGISLEIATALEGELLTEDEIAKLKLLLTINNEKKKQD